MGWRKVSDMNPEQLKHYREFMRESKARSRERAVAEGRCLQCTGPKEKDRAELRTCKECTDKATARTMRVRKVERRMKEKVVKLRGKDLSVNEIVKRTRVSRDKVSEYLRASGLL